MSLRIGQKHFKPQKFAGNLLGIRALERSCVCEGGHDPIVGRTKSKASAEYPKALCLEYAKLLIAHLKLMGKEEFLAYRMKALKGELPTGPKR